MVGVDDHHAISGRCSTGLRTGAPWRDLPERLGPWQTVYHYFNRWREEGVFDRILEAL